MKSHRKHLLIVAGLIASLAGEAGAAGIYNAKTTAAVYLYSSGGYVSYVTSVYLPPGTWVVQSLSPGVNFGATDIMRCSLWMNGAPLTSSAAMMGGDGGMPAALGIQNLAVVTLSYSNTIQLYCGHDGGVPNQRIDPGAQLVATRAPAS